MNAKFQNLHAKIVEILDDDCFAAIGIRATRSKVESKIGRELKESCVWVDGRRTNERLGGVCTIGIADDTPEALIKAIQTLGKSACEEFGIESKPFAAEYEGLDVILVQGERSWGGEDIGERVIENGVTVWAVSKIK